MKTYIIIVLALVVLRSLVRFIRQLDKNKIDGCGELIAWGLFIASNVLALIFACML